MSDFLLVKTVKKFCDGLKVRVLRPILISGFCFSMLSVCARAKAAREEIATILMWEICKNKSAAFKEVDRTVVYINDTIAELKKLENSSTAVVHDSGIIAQIKRSPLGVVLCAAPFNYPVE